MRRAQYLAPPKAQVVLSATAQEFVPSNKSLRVYLDNLAFNLSKEELEDILEKEFGIKACVCSAH